MYLRWSPVSDNKLLLEVVYLTVSKIDLYRISRKEPKTHRRRDSSETLSTLDWLLPNSSSTLFLVEKVWSILLSRPLRRGIWLVV